MDESRVIKPPPFAALLADVPKKIDSSPVNEKSAIGIGNVSPSKKAVKTRLVSMPATPSKRKPALTRSWSVEQARKELRQKIREGEKRKKLQNSTSKFAPGVRIKEEEDMLPTIHKGDQAYSSALPIAPVRKPQKSLPKVKKEPKLRDDSWEVAKRRMQRNFAKRFRKNPQLLNQPPVPQYISTYAPEATLEFQTETQFYAHLKNIFLSPVKCPNTIHGQSYSYAFIESPSSDHHTLLVAAYNKLIRHTEVKVISESLAGPNLMKLSVRCAKAAGAAVSFVAGKGPNKKITNYFPPPGDKGLGCREEHRLNLILEEDTIHPKGFFGLRVTLVVS